MSRGGRRQPAPTCCKVDCWRPPSPVADWPATGGRGRHPAPRPTAILDAVAAGGPSDVSVRLAGGYYFHALKRLMRDLEPVFAIDGPVSVDLDLTDLTFLG